MAIADVRSALAALADGSATPEMLREIVTSFPTLRPVVAAYPGADDALLAWLGGLHDPAVDIQLAKRTGVVAPPPPPMPAPASVATPGLITQVPTAGAPAPAAAAPAETPTGPPARRRRWPVVAAVLGVLVLLGGGLGAAFATGLLDGSEQNASAAPKRTSSAAPLRPTESAAPNPTPFQPTTEPTPEPQSSIAGFTCWDGVTHPLSSSCEPPASKDAAWRYLQFVYPSLAGHAECEPVDSSAKGGYTGFTVMWDCELGDVLLRYRFWENPADAVGLYNNKYDAETTAESYDLLVGGEPVQGWLKVDRDTRKGPDGVKRVVSTAWLPEFQLSLSVEGNTSKTMWAGLDKIRIRPVDQVLGHPENEVPGEAPISFRPA